jgi:REP element-mobilizing transposase RayT
VNKHPFFQEERDYRFFIRACFETAATFKIRTFAYCLMPNHFHICLQTPNGDISSFLHRFLTRVAVVMNRRLDHSGHLFEGRTKTLLIEDELYFETVIAYVLMNPVRAGLCRDPFGYPWSSASEMMRDHCRVDLRTIAERVAGRSLSVEQSEHAATIVRWLRALEVDRNARLFRDGQTGMCSASAALRKAELPTIHVAEVHPARTVQFSRRLLDRASATWTWPEITSVADNIVARFSSSAQRWPNPTQDVAIYIAHVAGGWSYRKIHEQSGAEGSHSAIGMAINRMRLHPNRKRLGDFGARPSHYHTSPPLPLTDLKV